ncbi:MAG TPA: CpsD/CapB family tyrosine-protein kinase [Steroidobacteraceae bacterium]|nr:CpsD/CapB family tyrosine-protein kinase [Steroidobacteraceae bacterium]
MIAHRILGPGTPLAADERAAAAYRMIRTRLVHKVRGNSLQSIAITSPEAGEGKSITAINIALSLARDPTNNVVLLDLDMRNPSVCRYLGVRPPHELISYFTGDVAPNDVLFSIGPENLALAGSLASTDLASELLGSGRLEALLAHVSNAIPNPVILLDMPPVLVTDEALLVAPRVDATLLVVAEGKTRRDALVRARTVLADFNLAGVLLNRSTESTGASGYYYHYRQ